MAVHIGLAGAFLRRDWLNESSYRVMFLFEAVNLIGSLVVFFAVGELVGQDAPALEPYGGDYFAFALIGLAIGGYSSISLGAFANRVRQAQVTGTLEAMLVSPTSGGVVLLMSGIWDYLLTTFRLCIYVLIGLLFFDLRFDINAAAALPMAIFSLIAFAATGLIMASLMLVVKRGEAAASSASLITGVLGGLLFPVTLLPDAIAWLHYFVPLYYALDGLRRALLVGAGPADIFGSLVGIAVCAVLLSGLAAFSVRWALHQTRVSASLAHY